MKNTEKTKYTFPSSTSDSPIDQLLHLQLFVYKLTVIVPI